MFDQILTKNNSPIFKHFTNSETCLLQPEEDTDKQFVRRLDLKALKVISKLICMQTLHMPDVSYFASRETKKAPLEEDGMISTFVLL